MRVKSEKILIREKRIEDASEDYQWRIDEELSRLDATRPLNMSYNDFLRYSKDELEYPSTRSMRFAIDTLDDKHIGNCMFYDLDRRRGEAELGIMIGDRDYWNRGFGTDAVDTLLYFMFVKFSLNRVYLHTLDWNYRAQSSFTKSGFRVVKNVRRSGLDFIQMEILREEWDQHRLSENKSITICENEQEEMSAGESQA